jgi:glycosyltransferase involved in cell wall biosynthesis
MNIIYVSRSASGSPHPFVQEQADNLIKNYNLKIDHFLITRGGIGGYLSAIIDLFYFTRKNKADIIHVHYGLSALVVVFYKLLFLKRFKMIITFHGSDINKKSERTFSLLAARFSSHNILVSPKMSPFFKHNYSVIPCGIDTNIKLAFRKLAREENNWGENDFVILFSSSFDREEKDPGFAFQVTDKFKASTTKNIRFIELKGYNRTQVTKLMQAADVLILCSKREGSPQVIKESILNGLPVIANDVGDVKSICSGVDNCFIVEKDTDEYVKHLKLIAQSNSRIQNRNPVIERFDNNIIANKIFDIYHEILI